MVSATFVRRILLPIFVLGVAVAHAQTVTKVSGDGQLVIQSIQSSNPLIVLVRDASGNPLPNVQVKWVVSSGPGSVQVLSPANSTTIAPGYTGPNGEAYAAFVATVPNPQQSYVPSTVTASYENASVQFTEISVGTTNNTPNVQAIPTPLPAAANLSGPAGQQGSVAISVQFYVTQGPQSGQGVGNVAVTATMDNPQDASTVTCAGGVVYSNAAGVATCTLVYGGKIGQGSFTLSAGGLQNFDYRYSVVAGAPAAIALLSGNKSFGVPGQEITLTAQLTDIGGNVLSGIPMIWAPVVAGTATLSTTTSTTDSTGRVSTQVTLGNTSGPIQIKVSTADGKVSALFTITVNVVVKGLSPAPGTEPQSALVNTEFPNPLVVIATDANGNPVAGVPVTFALTSGSATLGANGQTSVTVNTGANGQASTTVTAGATAGPVVITASTTVVTTTPVTFNLTVIPPGPVCDTNLSNNDTFFNGASFVPNFVAPGAVAVMNCTGIANGIEGVVASDTYGFEPLPTTVQGVTVQFNPPSGPYAPIFYLANINGKQSMAIQVPFEITPGSVPVVVTANGETNIGNLVAQVLPASPGFFEYVMSDGVSRAVALRPDGSVVTLNNKAQKGEVIRVFVTGMMPPTNSSGASEISTNNYVPLGSDITITTPIIFGINHEGFGSPTVIYAHNLIGVWEVQFTVPSAVPSGNDVALDIIVPVNGTNYAAKGTHIPIQ